MAFLICILLLLAVLVIGTRKNSCVLVHEDYRYNKNNTSGFWCRQSRCESALQKKKKWRNMESRINRLKRDYNGGTRNLNGYWDAMTHMLCN